MADIQWFIVWFSVGSVFLGGQVQCHIQEVDRVKFVSIVIFIGFLVVSICIYICVYIYVYIYLCVYNICVYIYMCIYLYVYISICVYI